MIPAVTDEPRVFAPDSGSARALVRLPAGIAAVAVRCSPEKESGNEDVAAVVPLEEGALLVIADGCGGHAAGGEAARLAVGAVVSRVAGSDGEVRSAILAGFDDANRAVSDLGVGAACTLAVVELQGRTLRPYHAGDSEVLVVGQRGRRKFQTLAHAPVSYAVEAGLIGESEALHHEHRHIVSNHVGTPEMRIEVGPAIRLAPRDTVLVGSDGLFDNLHTDEIIDLIRAGPLDDALEALLRSADARMTSPASGQPSKPDDLSFILFRPGP